MAFDDDDSPTDTSKFGAAQPLMDPIAKAYDKVRSVFKNIPGKDAPPQPADTSWHDQKVDEANDSFRKAAAKPAEPTTPTTRKVLRKAPRKR